MFEVNVLIQTTTLYMTYLVFLLANPLKRIILAKDSILVESSKVSIPIYACFKDNTAGPIPGIFLQASVTYPVSCSMYFVIRAGFD